MSYTIVYDRQFIKLSDGRIIPMILCGSNNCWETDRYGNSKRRERYWTPFWQVDTIAYSPEKLMKKVESYTGGEYQEHFMRGGKWVDDAAFLRFFKNGIKESKTIQELVEERIHTPAIRAYLSIWTKVEGKEDWDRKHTTECSHYLRSDDEIIAFLDEADVRVNGKTPKESIYICMEYYGKEPLPKPKRERKPKQRLTGEFYIVAFNSGNYVTRLDRAGLHHCPYIGYAKQFQTEQDAEKWVKQRNLSKRFRGEFKVEKAA